ncbi:hypothetical protein M569_00202, partial [Genlisea aurea]
EDSPPALNYVPEVVLKKRKNNEEWAIKRKLQLQERVKRRKSNAIFIKRPEEFVREYRDREVDFIRMKDRIKWQKRAPSLPESKLLFVIRIGGKTDMHPKSKKILYSLRLNRIFNGVFLEADEQIMNRLVMVEPFVTYGYPNIKSVKDLIYRKGVVNVGGERRPLTDNNIVEQKLGKHNIICIEDMVNEIASVGKHFGKVSKFLCPFNLNNPQKALRGRKNRFDRGGDSGNRRDLINELISKMN